MNRYDCGPDIGLICRKHAALDCEQRHQQGIGWRVVAVAVAALVATAAAADGRLETLNTRGNLLMTDSVSRPSALMMPPPPEQFLLSCSASVSTIDEAGVGVAVVRCSFRTSATNLSEPAAVDCSRLLPVQQSWESRRMVRAIAAAGIVVVVVVIVFVG
jgi:hypothetical protein